MGRLALGIVAGLLAGGCGKGGGYVVHLDSASLPLVDCNSNDYDSGAGLPDPYVVLAKNWDVEDVWRSLHFDDEVEPVYDAPAFGSEALSASDLMEFGLRITVWDEDGAVAGPEQIAEQVHLFTQDQLDAGVLTVSVQCVDVQLSLH